MSDAVAIPAAPASSTPSKAKKASKPKTAGAKVVKKPTHPPTSEMVNNAIKSLKERGGSSLQAIKKYISANYKTDAEKLAPFIKKYLKSAVVAGTLVQTKGKGASGSFKLSAPAVKDKKPTKAAVAKPKKVVAAKKPTKAAVKKPKSPKKVKTAAAEGKKKPAAKPKKSPSKAKKTAGKPAAAKPKTPKPKKVAAKPKVAAKRVAPKKK